MPVDPSYKYVDQVHDKTVAKASEGWRYGCFNKPRSSFGYLVQDGWHIDGRRKMIAHKPAWKHNPAQRYCGHLTSEQDTACAGCKWRHLKGEVVL